MFPKKGNITLCMFNTYRARLKAIRLKSYWNKICEDEKRSQTRNEQLLKDFERAEAHLQELHARTEKLQEAKACIWFEAV